MSLLPDFEYRRLSKFTYHVLSRPNEIRDHILKWSLREWESDHNEAPQEHWTIEWMEILPKMEFSLTILQLEDIRPHPDLWQLEKFQASLRARADEREEAMLHGVSIAPLLVNQRGYTRYGVLKRYQQREVFVYLGQV